MKRIFRMGCLIGLLFLSLSLPVHSANAETIGDEYDFFNVSKNNAGSFILPASLQIIEEEAFAGTNACEVLTLGDVREIQDRAFSNMPSLKSVVLPESISILGDELFLNNHEVVVYGYAGSAVEAYAKTHHMEFRSIHSVLPGTQKEVGPKSNPVSIIHGFLISVAFFFIIHQQRRGRLMYELNPMGRKSRIVLFDLDGEFP